MAFFKFLLGLIFLFNFASKSHGVEPVLQDQAQEVLSKWFSIDPKHDIKMQKLALPDDEHGKRYQISFTSDDQQSVNGLLAMPILNTSPVKIALLLHPMGRDHSLWWNKDNALSGGTLSEKLRQQGYAVLTLDARRHGKRKVEDMGLKELLARAHSDHDRLYIDMIIGTVRDYRLALAWVKKDLNIPTPQVLAIGYSMGAQMSLLLASYETDIKQVLAMVPPYVEQKGSPVAPRHHVGRIKDAKLMLFAAKQDPYSSNQENQYVFDSIGTSKKTLTWFDSGHVLPKSYLQQALTFIDSLSPEKP